MNKYIKKTAAQPLKFKDPLAQKAYQKLQATKDYPLGYVANKLLKPSVDAVQQKVKENWWRPVVALSKLDDAVDKGSAKVLRGIFQRQPTKQQLKLINKDPLAAKAFQKLKNRDENQSFTDVLDRHLSRRSQYSRQLQRIDPNSKRYIDKVVSRGAFGTMNDNVQNLLASLYNAAKNQYKQQKDARMTIYGTEGGLSDLDDNIRTQWKHSFPQALTSMGKGAVGTGMWAAKTVHSVPWKGLGYLANLVGMDNVGQQLLDYSGNLQDAYDKATQTINSGLDKLNPQRSAAKSGWTQAGNKVAQIGGAVAIPLGVGGAAVKGANILGRGARIAGAYSKLGPGAQLGLKLVSNAPGIIGQTFGAQMAMRTPGTVLGRYGAWKADRAALVLNSRAFSDLSPEQQAKWKKQYTEGLGLLSAAGDKQAITQLGRYGTQTTLSGQKMNQVGWFPRFALNFSRHMQGSRDKADMDNAAGAGIYQAFDQRVNPTDGSDRATSTANFLQDVKNNVDPNNPQKTGITWFDNALYGTPEGADPAKVHTLKDRITQHTVDSIVDQLQNTKDVDNAVMIGQKLMALGDKFAGDPNSPTAKRLTGAAKKALWRGVLNNPLQAHKAMAFYLKYKGMPQFSQFVKNNPVLFYGALLAGGLGLLAIPLSLIRAGSNNQQDNQKKKNPQLVRRADGTWSVA